MKVKVIEDITTWNAFFEKAGSPTFHQAWEWGEFQKSLGYQIMRLGVYDNKSLKAISLVIKIKSKRGNYLFIPHGPLFKVKSSKLSQTIPESLKSEAVEILSSLTNYLKDVANAENYWFIRIAPVLKNHSDNEHLFTNIGFRTAPIYVHAETMWAVDLTPSEDELLAGMRKTTRYLIRKGIKDGVTIHIKDSMQALDEFWKLYEVTYDRENFTPFPYTYIENEFKSFHKNKNSHFFLGEVPPKFAQEGASQFLAGSLVIFTKSSGFYHQGASIHTKIPVPYVLQWQSMLFAKKRGCQFYNFYGIFDQGRTPKAWKGLTLFKQGFGGFEIRYLPTQDYIISPKYYLSYCIDKYLAWNRGI